MTQIRNLFNTPNRFLRSTNLERDFLDDTALDAYALTPFVSASLDRVLDGLRPQSGRRAWRVTGDYGVGKSSFALLLARYLADPKSKAVQKLLRAGQVSVAASAPMLPILMTGDREPIAPAIARAIAIAYRSRTRPSKAVSAVLSAAEAVMKSGRTSDFSTLLDAITLERLATGQGVALIVDELGKFLEYAVSLPEREDIYVLQLIAERAARSGKTPFIFVGLLHQGIHAYTEKLSHTQKHEWEKIAGRFDEIVFDQPLVHTASLISHALGIKPQAIGLAVRRQAATEGKAAIKAGTFPIAPVADWASIYPLHPVLLPVLVRFFARFGQHERSLFGFLLSNEAGGLQEFARRPSAPGEWYRLSDFFDYIRSVFGHRLSGASYRSSWLRLVEAVDRAQGLRASDEQILKSVAVLNLLDSDDLLPVAGLLKAATGQVDLDKSLKRLLEEGVLFQRGHAGGYRLWSGASINLYQSLLGAYSAIGDVEDYTAVLASYLDKAPIAARRHYLRTGTLRYFDLCYSSCGDLGKAIDAAPSGDGKIVVALPATDLEASFAVDVARQCRRDDVIVVVPGPLNGFSSLYRDVKAWEFVQHQTPELASDGFAAEEVNRQLRQSVAILAAGVEEFIGIRSEFRRETRVFWAGKLAEDTATRLAPMVSMVCGRIYKSAPHIHNELINRNVLSSAAAAARMRLIEGMFSSPSLPLLGIDGDRSPPEKSMYLSVLARGNVHRARGKTYYLDEPRPDSDDLQLAPALQHLLQQLEASKGARVPVDELMVSLRRRPYGVRDGVIPLLLAICVCTHGHEVAVYESGTFLHGFGAADFLRLTKQPALFSLQLCRVAGVRADVFRKLLECFVPEARAKQAVNLLDVVGPLCRFAAQLPESTRKSTDLDREAVAVRDALLQSTDPSDLLFNSLPEACGLGRFSVDGRRDPKRTQAFVGTLQAATTRLRDAYATLLATISSDTVSALGSGSNKLDRSKIAARAARVAVVAREGKLKAFAQRLRDPGLSEDGWLEALASFVANKPPHRWSKLDRDNWLSEIAQLGELFLRTEATAYSTGAEPSRNAVRLGITRADGIEASRVIEIDSEDMSADVAQAIRRVLPSERDARLSVLYLLLWDILNEGKQIEAPEMAKPRSSKGQ